MTTLRISLTLDDFKQLVAGKIVYKVEDAARIRDVQIEISLQDIGFSIMQQALDDARLEVQGL